MNPVSRAPRQSIAVSLSVRLVAGVLVMLGAACRGEAAQRITLEVREPVGIARGSFPVATLIDLPEAVSPTTPFRLIAAGEPVNAQFRADTVGAATSRWWLDFTATLRPFQTRRYVIEYGDDVEPGPELETGHKLAIGDDAFVITNDPYIDWTVPRDLRGLLRSVLFRPIEHLQSDSVGLVLRDRERERHVLGGEGTTARVVRQGATAVALRFEGQGTGPLLSDVSWTVDLLFPVRVSWVEVTCRVDDPYGRVDALGLQLRLNLDNPTLESPTLVDMGAASTVYATLVGNHEMLMQAWPSEADDSSRPTRESNLPWLIFRGPPGRARAFVFGQSNVSDHAEGWIHVMDRRRCLAMAVERFAADYEERITVGADGSVTYWKDFVNPNDVAETGNRPVIPSKRLRTWLHFVHFPPQQSAGTSPQAMQHPLQVRVVDDTSYE